VVADAASQEESSAMFPFEVDPGWYDAYWLSERPGPQHRSVAGHLARFAVVVALLAGGGAVLSRYHVSQDENGYQDWEQE
jgi:hypothetical protein